MMEERGEGAGVKDRSLRIFTELMGMWHFPTLSIHTGITLMASTYRQYNEIVYNTSIG